MAQVLHTTLCYRSCNRHSGASDMICYKLIWQSGCRNDYGDLGETICNLLVPCFRISDYLVHDSIWFRYCYI